MRRIGAVLVPSFALLALGCGGYIGSAQRAYNDGRYLEVAENLGEHEDEVQKLSPAKQADYGLYRGLSLMQLGDHEAANHWLEFAASVEQNHPGALRPEGKRELSEARGKLAKMAAEDEAKRASLPQAP